MLVSDLPTPQVLVDRQRLLRNISRVQDLANAAGISLRPHAKTHKSPAIARWQIERGAAGICCAKVGEAEVMAAAGIADIRLAYPVNPSNASARAGLDGARLSLDRRRSPGRRARRGPRRCIAPAAPSMCSSRLTSAFIDAASIPSHRQRWISSARSHRCPGCVFADCSAMPATAIRRLRKTSSASSPDARPRSSRRCGDRAAGAGIALEEISVGATPTLRFSVAAAGHHRAPARQLRVLRSHAARARRRVPRRLRPDGARNRRLEAGSRPPRSSTAAARR